MCSKYFSSLSIDEWFHISIKSSKGSIAWKVLVEAFPLVAPWTVWRVGNGCHIRVGLDPLLGTRNWFRLSEPLLNHMCEANISFLSDVCVGEPQMRGRAECKDLASLGLSGDLVEECDSYIYLPCENSIAIIRET